MVEAPGLAQHPPSCDIIIHNHAHVLYIYIYNVNMGQAMRLHCDLLSLESPESLKQDAQCSFFFSERDR